MFRFLSASPLGARPCPRRPGMGWWWCPQQATSPWPSTSARWYNILPYKRGVFNSLSLSGRIWAGGRQHHDLHVRKLDRDHPRLRDHVLQVPWLPPSRWEACETSGYRIDFIFKVKSSWWVTWASMTTGLTSRRSPTTDRSCSTVTRDLNWE